MTNSINLIRGNNGTNLAASPTITTLRSPGSTTILVNTTTGLPASFVAEMGALDLATGLIINGVVFRGHPATGEVIIDQIAAGYTDAGSAANDVIVLKPTAEWANNIANTLAVSHNDDGTLKSDVVTTAKILDANVTLPKIYGGTTAGRLVTNASGVISVGFSKSYEADQNNINTTIGAVLTCFTFAAVTVATGSLVVNVAFNKMYLAVGGTTVFDLYDGETDLGEICRGSSSNLPVSGQKIYTGISAGSHTFSVRGSNSIGSWQLIQYHSMSGTIVEV